MTISELQVFDRLLPINPTDERDLRVFKRAALAARSLPEFEEILRSNVLSFDPDFTREQMQKSAAALLAGPDMPSLTFWPEEWGGAAAFAQRVVNVENPSKEDVARWRLLKSAALAAPDFLAMRQVGNLRDYGIDAVRFQTPEVAEKTTTALALYTGEVKLASDAGEVVFKMPAAPKPVKAITPLKVPGSRAANPTMAPAPTGAGQRFKDFLWAQENAGKTGYNSQTGTWKTYDDRGHPAVGPGIRVPAHGSFPDAEVRRMLDARVQQHLDQARSRVDKEHGAGSFDRLPEHYRYGLADFSYNGVPAPKLTAAMLAGDADAIRREAVRYTRDKSGARVPLSRRNQAWLEYFGPQIVKQSAVRMGAGVIFRNKDGTCLLQKNENGKLRPAGGGKEDCDCNLRATIIRELGEEFGLSPEFCDTRLVLRGFITGGKYEDCALFEMRDHGLEPVVYQASNSPDEKVELVESDLDDPRYVGPDLLEDLRPARNEQEEDAARPALVKSAAAAPASPLEARVAALDMEALEREARADIDSGRVTRREKGVRMLNALEGLKRTGLKPSDLLIGAVPVIPPAFRPFSVAGDTFVPGDANELYRDLAEHRTAFEETKQKLGAEAAKDARLALYDATRALYGFGESPTEKLVQRGVGGFLRQIVGPGSPKYSFVQRKMLSKPVDNVGRGVIIPDPDLGLDEIGIPRDLAWPAFSSFIQRRLVRAGMSPGQALTAIKDRSKDAERALEEEIKERPVLYSRAPSWHRFSALAGYAKLVDGNAIKINNFSTTGLNADFDGDQINFHVPALPESVIEAKERLLPSKMLFSIRNQDSVMPVAKHEQILGLMTAQEKPAQKKWKFPTRQRALEAIKSGEVALSDEIEIG